LRLAGPRRRHCGERIAARLTAMHLIDVRCALVIVRGSGVVVCRVFRCVVTGNLVTIGISDRPVTGVVCYPVTVVTASRAVAIVGARSVTVRWNHHHPGFQVDAQVPLAAGALLLAEHLLGATLLHLVPHARIEQCSELS